MKTFYLKIFAATLFLTLFSCTDDDSDLLLTQAVDSDVIVILDDTKAEDKTNSTNPNGSGNTQEEEEEEEDEISNP